MENSNEYCTKDFYLSCVLRSSKKLQLKELIRNKGNIVTFVFKDPDSMAEEIIKKHWSGENKVSSRDLIEAINEIKTRLFSGI